jgi:hypothetical protein
MKKLMFTLTALLFAVAASYSQSESPMTETSKEVKKEMVKQDQEVKKKEISFSQIPQPIQKKLKSKEMAPWKPMKAYLTEDGTYIIEMMNGKNPEETKSLKYKKDGTALEK